MFSADESWKLWFSIAMLVYQRVPTIYKAYVIKGYVRGYTPKIWPNIMVLTYLHFRILEFPLSRVAGWVAGMIIDSYYKVIMDHSRKFLLIKHQ